MNGLRILSKRSLNDCVGHIGPATLGLRPLGSETSAYLLSYLAIAFDFKANLRMFGNHRNCLLNLKNYQVIYFDLV